MRLFLHLIRQHGKALLLQVFLVPLGLHTQAFPGDLIQDELTDPSDYQGSWEFFWMLFQFIYGTLFIILFGKQFSDIIAIIALITSLLFAVFTFAYIYRQYKKHIIET